MAEETYQITQAFDLLVVWYPGGCGRKGGIVPYLFDITKEQFFGFSSHGTVLDRGGDVLN